MREQITVGLFRQYESELDLSWPVEYWLDDTEESCEIDSDPEKQIHRVILADYVLANDEIRDTVITHELCRAYLAERVDPAFATTRFPRAYAGFQGRFADWLKESRRLLFLASFQTSIWANDVRHQRWPELSQIDYDSFDTTIIELASVGGWELLGSTTSILSIALNCAERERHGLAETPSMVDRLGEQQRRFARRALRVYRNLPQLAMDRERDLPVLEKSVQEIAEVLPLRISPRLVEEDGLMRWEF